MKLIIHTGLPKTGTSSIQNYLIKNHNILKENGIYYPYDTNNEDIIGSGNAYWLYYISKHPDKNYRQSAIKEKIKEIKSKALKNNCDCIILSSEYISTLAKKDIFQFIDSIEHLQLDVNIILYTRDPYQWYFSSWLQSIRRQGNKNWLYESIIKNPEFSLRPLAFKKTLESLDGYFKINFINYSEKEENKNVILNFINNLPFDVKKLKFNNAENDFKNKSMSKFETFLMLYFNRYTDGDTGLNDFIFNKGILIPDSKLFFYDRRTEDVIAKYLNEIGENYVPTPSGSLGDFSEAAIFQTLTERDKYILEAIKTFCYFLKNNLEEFRKNLVEKINLYRDSPFKNQTGADFDALAYLILNIDVYKENIDPYEHYLKFGLNEGRIKSTQKLIEYLK